MAGRKIMLVEEDPVARQAVVEAVRNSPFEICTQVLDVEAALQLCGKVQPDIVVLSLSCQGGSLKMIRAFKEAVKDVNVVITYDSGNRYLVVTAMREGACACLRKPFDRERVLISLQRAAKGVVRRDAPVTTIMQVAEAKWPARVRTGKLLPRWQDAVVTDVAPSGLTITCDSPLEEGAELQIEISLPKGERIRAPIQVRQSAKLPSGLRAVRVVFGTDMDRDTRRAIIACMPRPDGSPQKAAAQAPGARTGKDAAAKAGLSVKVEKVEESVFLVKLSGSLDERAIEQVHAVLENIPFESTAILLDLEDLAHIDSSGIGILLSVKGRALRRKGRLALSAVRPRVQTVLDHLGVADVFEIFADRAKALASLRGG